MNTYKQSLALVGFCSGMALSCAAFAQADLATQLGPVIPADKGWVQSISSGPVCPSFVMQPSGRTWIVERGTPMHDDIMRAVKDNADAWRFYVLATALGVKNLKQPIVVVSASTSPMLPGSNHPSYDGAVTYQRSTAICGQARPPYQIDSFDSGAAIAVLPASGY